MNKFHSLDQINVGQNQTVAQRRTEFRKKQIKLIDLVC